MFDQPCSAAGGVWTFSLIRPAGYQALAVWDSSGGPTDFSVPDGYVQYRVLDGSLIPIDESLTVSITDTPILLENQSPE